MRTIGTKLGKTIGISLSLLGATTLIAAIYMTQSFDHDYISAIAQYNSSPSAENKCRYLEAYIRNQQSEIQIRYTLLFVAGMLLGMSSPFLISVLKDRLRSGPVSCTNGTNSSGQLSP